MSHKGPNHHHWINCPVELMGDGTQFTGNIPVTSSIHRYCYMRLAYGHAEHLAPRLTFRSYER